MNKQSKNGYQGWSRRTLSTQEEPQESMLKKLTLNKWSLTFAVMLVMFSAWLGLEEVDKHIAAGQQDILYVTDTIPYDIQRVNTDNSDNADKPGSVEVLANSADGAQNMEGQKSNGQPAENKDDKAGAQAEENKLAENKTAESKPEENKPEENKPEENKQGTSGNYSINSDSDFFINYRLEREKARSRQLELLQSLIDDEKTTSEMRAEAQHKVIEQAEAIEQELMLESILVAQYGGEAVVFIQPEKVNVVLSLSKENGIADNEAEKIARLVDNYTAIGFENVIIVLKN